MTAERILRGLRVLVEGEIRPAALHIDGGRIAAVTGYDEVPRESRPIDVGRKLVMAGLVDTHVHVNEPGRTAWEGFSSATRAAAAGGITTLVDMPLNSVPPTTTVAALEEKRAATEGQLWIDVGFWGGVVPGNTGELAALVDAGALGFKAFLCPSGVDEFPHAERADLEAALPILRDAGVPLLCHAELPGPLAEAEARLAGAPTDYATFLASRPRRAEDLAVALLVELCRETRAPIHVVHHSSSDSLELLARAKDAGLPLSAETCPHYLHLTAEQIAAGRTEFKCAPPIREADNRERLWEALAGGVLDLVVSDHSPCTADLKGTGGDFLAAWGGIASLQLTLPLIWTELRDRGLPLERLTEWMSARPAALANLGDRGRIAPGQRADLVVWSPEEAFRVDAAALFHKNAITPYAGELLYGVVDTTFLAGEVVYQRGQHVGTPSGRTIIRA